MQAIEQHPDQASGLRRMWNQRPTQVMAVTSGKGGVGKDFDRIYLSNFDD